MFLSHVQELAPELYQEWQHYIRMEEISRQIYHVLINEKKDTNVVKTLSKRLLTTKDEANYVILLEGLLHKVFKEEWVKTMLALGEDPESVMELIDQYWDNRENANQHGAGGHHGKGRHREKDKQQEKGRHREKDKQQEKGRHREKDKQQEKGRHQEKDKHQEKGKQQGNNKKNDNGKNKRDGKNRGDGGNPRKGR